MKKFMTVLLCGLVSLGALSAESLAKVELNCVTGGFQIENYSYSYSPLIFPIPAGILKFEYYSPYVNGGNRFHIGAGAIGVPVPNLMVTGGYSHCFQTAETAKHHWEVNFSVSLGIIALVDNGPVVYDDPIVYNPPEDDHYDSGSDSDSDSGSNYESDADEDSGYEVCKRPSATTYYDGSYGGSGAITFTPIPFYELSLEFAWMPNKNGFYFAIGPSIFGVMDGSENLNIGLTTLKVGLGWKF